MVIKENKNGLNKSGTLNKAYGLVLGLWLN
jgi:hypothetical protein